MENGESAYPGIAVYICMFYVVCTKCLLKKLCTIH